MKTFNKCLKKQIKTNFILNNLNITSKNFNKVSLISKTFARKIGRPTFNDSEATGEKTFETKIENFDFQAPPKIKIENDSNDFEKGFAKENFDGDRAFNRDREFKQKKRGNFQNETNQSDFGDNQNPRSNRREMFGERDNRGFKGDREFRNKRFEDNGSDNFREKRSFDRESNFERKERNFRRDDNNEFGGERKFERRRFDGERSDKFRNNREENNENPGERSFDRSNRRFDNREGGERNFRSKRFDNGENEAFKSNRSYEKRDFKDKFGERENRPRRFENDNRSEGDFKPRRFNDDRFGDKPRGPRRFGDAENQGFDNKRDRSFDRRSDKFTKYDKFNNNFDNQGFRGERRFDQSNNENRQKFNKREKRQEEDLPNKEEEDFEKLMGEINVEDAKVFGGQDTLNEENKINVKLPKKSFKDNKTERVQDFDNSDITKIDDAEKYINENKPKKRLRFGEEKKTDSIQEMSGTPKEEMAKDKDNINEEDLNEIETEEPKDKEVEKNGVVYEYRDNKKKYEYIYGSHAVESALSYNYRKNLDLFVSMNYKDNTPDLIQKLINLAKSKNVSIKYLVKDKLEKFTQKRPTNGVVLKSEPREYVSIKSFDYFSSNFIKKPTGNLIVLLDQIVDPQNFGSIIRSAFFIGADFVVVNRIRKPPISAAVSKVSSGASECMDLFSVRNIKHFLSDANKKNWTILNTAIEKEDDIAKTDSLELEDLENNENTPLTTSENKPVENKSISLNQLKINPEENVILILGSEGFGVSNDVMKSFVNYNIYIPPQLDKSKVNQHPFDMIDSLNVGVSAGIIINHVCSQMKTNVISDSETKSSLEENRNEIKIENNDNIIENNDESKRTEDRADIKI